MPVLLMFSRSVNDTSRVVRGDATAWSNTYDRNLDDSIGVFYNRNIFIVLSTEWRKTEKK